MTSTLRVKSVNNRQPHLNWSDSEPKEKTFYPYYNSIFSLFMSYTGGLKSQKIMGTERNKNKVPLIVIDSRCINTQITNYIERGMG